MGKKRIVAVSETLEETPQTEEARVVVKEEARLEKKKEKKPEKQEVHLPGLKGGQRVRLVTAEAEPEDKEEKPVTPAITETLKKTESQKRTKPPQKKGRKYLAARAKVDPTKLYPLPEAIKLAKETSWGKFDGSLEAHLVVSKKGLKGEVSLPYFVGKTKRVAIADEETLAKIEAGKIDFNVLLATPALMPNLVKYAKILGPKGLMPNPKAGTIVEDLQKAREKFQKSSFTYKTESNAPLLHTVFGKVSQKDEELEANLKTLLSAIGPKNIKKAVIKATMGQAVKIEVDNLPLIS